MIKHKKATFLVHYRKQDRQFGQGSMSYMQTLWKVPLQ